MPTDRGNAGQVVQKSGARIPRARLARRDGDLMVDDKCLLAIMDAGSAQRHSDGAASLPGPAEDPPRTFRRLRRRSDKRWAIPPAILHEPGETLEGRRILEEHEDPRLAYLLWASMRDASLWAVVQPAEPDQLAALFWPDAGERRIALIGEDKGDEPRVSLMVLARLLNIPQAADPEVMAAACMRVSVWARDRGAIGTAIAFAQVAALMVPGDAGPALSVGALVRGSAASRPDSARAGTWLRRAVALARQRGDWLCYSEAYRQLGALYVQRDQPMLASRHYEKAVRVARRTGNGQIRAAALHGLLQLAIAAGQLEMAEAYGKAAWRGYGKGHPHLPELLLDVALVWVLMGRHDRAVRILRAQLARRSTPNRALALSLLARAYAGIGAHERRNYQAAWEEAWMIIEEHGGGDGDDATALLHLAHAASALKDWFRLDTAVAHEARSRRANSDVAGQLADLTLRARQARGFAR